MKFTIDPTICEKFPNLGIGYVIADIVNPKTHPFVEGLKANLAVGLQNTYGINKTTYASNPTIELWRKVYEGFGVKPKTYPASVTSLVKRVVDGKGIWNISAVVDLYNCHSVMGLAPMGGYDMSNIQGDIVLRYGLEGETFLGLGAKEPEVVMPKHVVYGDEGGVTCWLWNHKDCQRTMITPETTQALFFVDCADTTKSPSLQNVVTNFSADLDKIGCRVLETGILDAKKSSVLFLAKAKAMPKIADIAKEELESAQEEVLASASNSGHQDGILSDKLRSDEQLSSILRELRKW